MGAIQGLHSAQDLLCPNQGKLSQQPLWVRDKTQGGRGRGREHHSGSSKMEGSPCLLMLSQGEAQAKGK